MREILIIILLSIPLTPISGQLIRKKLHNREVIIQNGDTTIKANILTEDIRERPSYNNKYFWCLRGEVKSNIGGYSGKLLHGEYASLVNNSLIESGQFNEGLRDGRWTSWYQSGHIKSIINYRGGKLDGIFIKYYENGSIEKELIYKKGKVIDKMSFISKIFKKDINPDDSIKLNQ